MNFREVHYKPYHLICEIAGGNVSIHCILDGRRDMQSLLERWLVRQGSFHERLHAILGQGAPHGRFRT